MANYDSDSSAGEDDYTETSVLLGYASKEATDDAISHLGGHPAWLDGKTAPSGDLAKCKVCNNLLSLLLELNGDLPERFPNHERRLYLLGCRQKACRRKEGCIRGFRAVRPSKLSKQPVLSTPASPPQEPPKPKADLGSSIFGSKPSSSSTSSNPFASPSSSNSTSNPFATASSLAAKPSQRPDPLPQPDLDTLPATFADKARISPTPSLPTFTPHGPPPPWPPSSSFPAPYPTFSLDADYETLSAPSATLPAQTRVDMDIDDPPATTNGSSSSKDANQEIFESTMDKTFQRFADRVAQNPEQVLRYEFGGQPLLYSRDDAVGRILAPAVGEVSARAGGAGRSRIPRCERCGGERTFEVQLMPNAIMELEAEEVGTDGMDWGTIVLEVCKGDCVPLGVGEGEVGYVEEWVGVQWEEVVKRR
ncbi:hypothetical protein KVT40_001588 [Elsinoe batatas]|uniref:Programmed cell death protein 2 C-terminal domain-containing protein n=1 Tax=Elsinoe batatas TaxID=2601811 RepID=A0A8K0PLI2_9PEZI|nr:hypothetical protein KVT40_001588 [Elsinoe batatas]